MHKKPKFKKHETLQAWLYLTPFLIIFSVFIAIPFFLSMYIAMHDYSGTRNLMQSFIEQGRFIWFDHFIKLAYDAQFWWSLIATILYMILTIPTGILLSLTLAVVLNNKLKFVKFFRTAYFLPYVLDMFVIGMIWVFIYLPDGPLNTVLKYMWREIPFLQNPWTALPSVAVVVVLKNLGFGMVLFLTALSNISPNIYEAADIDGLSWSQKFFYITLPLVKPVTFFLVVVGIMTTLNAFTEIFVMTNGNPVTSFIDQTVGATKITGFYLFEAFRIKEHYGYAAAMSYFLLVFALLVSWINYKFLQSKENK